ncbi:729_t:CDS:2, partial [Acaulospora colombiana]
DTFKFMFSLYNFIQLAKDAHGNLEQALHCLGEVKIYVEKMKLKRLTMNHKRKTDNHTDNWTSNKRRKLDEPADSEVVCDAANLEALDRAGYTIPEEIEGFESLIPLNAKMLKAISADGKEVIVKLTSEHEIEVLRHLHRNRPTKQTRIIPLLDVIDRRLMFLEGVVYLQDSSVAHLDLKPDNIVVQQNHESKEVNLNIIDFNISVFADANPTISASNGTDGWHAPEVKRGRPYNPLLADRWSCGRVLQYFADNMKPGQMRETMRLFSRQLMNETPSLRPKTESWGYKEQQEAQGTWNAIADALPPSMKGSHTFCILEHKLLGLITQTRTGYGHYGKYYHDFNIPEPYACPCGEPIQTHSHVLSLPSPSTSRLASTIGGL